MNERIRDAARDALNQSIVEQGYGDADIDTGYLVDALVEAGVLGEQPREVLPCPTPIPAGDLLVRRYARRPAIVEAVQVAAENLDGVAEWCGGSVHESTVHIDDDERGYGGYAHPGDWVVRWPGGFTVMPDWEDGWSVGFHDEFELPVSPTEETNP